VGEGVPGPARLHHVRIPHGEVEQGRRDRMSRRGGAWRSGMSGGGGVVGDVAGACGDGRWLVPCGGLGRDAITQGQLFDGCLPMEGG
jgi:hypothetical protein